MWLTRLRARWSARRQQLAFSQLEAERDVGTMGDAPAVDAFTGRHLEGAKALQRMINPKAVSKTEWKGD